MNEHLFKLKKDGKTVGYLELQGFQYPYPDHKPMFCGVRFQRVGEKNWGKTEMEWDTAHSFVTKDKNGKDVFAGDCCYSGNAEGYIRWSKTELTWMYEWDDKRGDTHSAPVSKVSDIEFIEDKEND